MMSEHNKPKLEPMAQAAQMGEWFTEYQFGHSGEIGFLPDITRQRIEKLFGSNIADEVAMAKLREMIRGFGDDFEMSQNAALYVSGYPEEAIHQFGMGDVEVSIARIGQFFQQQAGAESLETSRGALLPNKIAQPAVRQTVKPPIARMKPQYAPTPPAQRTVLGDGPLDSIDDLAIPQEDEKWQDKSLCAQTDPEIFFPEKGGSTRDAKRICRGCEVKAECLGYALDNDERFGIWGGLSERERRRLKRGIA